MGLDLETNYKPGWVNAMGDPEENGDDASFDAEVARVGKEAADRLVKAKNVPPIVKAKPQNTVQTSAGPQPPDARFIDHCKAEIEKADVIIQDCDKKIAEQQDRRGQAVRAKKMARAAVDAGTDGKDVDG